MCCHTEWCVTWTQVFSPQDSQQRVAAAVDRLAAAAAAGRNATLLAMGRTGSGKSYTLAGHPAISHGSPADADAGAGVPQPLRCESLISAISITSCSMTPQRPFFQTLDASAIRFQCFGLWTQMQRPGLVCWAGLGWAGLGCVRGSNRTVPTRNFDRPC